MGAIVKHWRRVAVTLVPVVLALLHALGYVPIGVLDHLDQIYYDARLRATMPQTLDERIVIVDIDEKSLAEVGRWPWGRNKVAQLVNKLFEQQKIAALGFDITFAEADTSSGLQQLTALADDALKDQPGFAERVRQLAPSLDYDAQFAKAIQGRPVTLGYYFNQDPGGRTSGQLPQPVFGARQLGGRPTLSIPSTGYGANISLLAQAARTSGAFNVMPDSDGVLRSLPLVIEYKENYYESLALSVFRLLTDMPSVRPESSSGDGVAKKRQIVDRIVLQKGNRSAVLPVDDRLMALVPYRGLGGPTEHSFRYISASDILNQRIPADALKDKIVFVGTTAPGLIDLRVTPMGEVYPGVEVHANMLSGMLDGTLWVRPDYAIAYDVLVLFFVGLLLAFGLPRLSAVRAVALSGAMVLSLTALNWWAFHSYNLVLPWATSVVMVGAAFGLNMSYGYFVESRAKRELAQLFGTYVPPELVDEMVKAPDSYSMQATNRELTVMFCDMRGFTKMSERMEPTQLQALLTGVFSRLTAIIRSHRGTIDKYMGDCVMAFWGAPVETPEHASLAVQAALDMVQAVRDINADHRARGLPEIGIGIGLNTGWMCVGDMGSNIRRSYTVIGDAVNLGSRLESLSKTYGVEIVVSETTRLLAPEFAWQELDRVRVKGKEQAVAIFVPLGLQNQMGKDTATELKAWAGLLKTYREQNWDQAEVFLLNLLRMNPHKYLYQLYADRVASMRHAPFDPGWDGATNFESK